MIYRFTDQYVTSTQVASDGVTLIYPPPIPTPDSALPGTWTVAQSPCLSADGTLRFAGEVFWNVVATFWSDDPWTFVSLAAGSLPSGVTILRWVLSPNSSLVQDASTRKLVFPPLPALQPVGN